MYESIVVVPNMIDGWANVQPFNAMLVIIFAANRMGRNSDSTYNNFGCPSEGQIEPK